MIYLTIQMDYPAVQMVISLMMKQALSMMQVRARPHPRLPDYGCK